MHTDNRHAWARLRARTAGGVVLSQATLKLTGLFVVLLVAQAFPSLVLPLRPIIIERAPLFDPAGLPSLHPSSPASRPRRALRYGLDISSAVGAPRASPPPAPVLPRSPAALASHTFEQRLGSSPSSFAAPFSEARSAHDTLDPPGLSTGIPPLHRFPQGPASRHIQARASEFQFPSSLVTLPPTPRHHQPSCQPGEADLASGNTEATSAEMARLLDSEPTHPVLPPRMPLPPAAFPQGCPGCGRQVTPGTPGLTAMGRTWHQKCFRCGYCKRNMAHGHVTPVTFAAGRPVCGRCRHARLRAREKASPSCAVCARNLAGASQVSANFWGEAFCQEHVPGASVCLGCGRLQPHGAPEPFVVSPTLHICHACMATAAPVNATLAMVRDYMGVQGLALPEAMTLSVAQVSYEELAQDWPATAGADSAAAYPNARMRFKNAGAGARVPERVEVLAAPLPVERLAADLVHELMHAHLNLRHPTMGRAYAPLSTAVEEGLCQFTEWLWLHRRSKDRDDSSNAGTASHRHLHPLHRPLQDYLRWQIERRRDRVYGLGFRVVRAAARCLGLSGILTVLAARNHSTPVQLDALREVIHLYHHH
ncbi:hypothetical protein CYMTET_47917 [Cymbomonas tetramitiformis]|uniref:LIM zinc-binding domain-containing protein n=1 Tax=Cymbomonas tetramitiformis TaxID=36881 RepID=A0AAE0EVI0_9CHLO|nr:hypothetical protein CYMTET_47917 [Cymbomonas tetramitiformis]